MPDEQLAGQDTPAVDGEVTQTASATTPAETTQAQTDGEQGGKDSPVPKTYTEEELRDRIERATAKAAAKAERRALREARDILTQQRPQQTTQASSDDGKPLRSQYASEDEWLDARDEWRDKQREHKAQQAKAQEQAKSLGEKTAKLYAEASKLPGFDSDSFDEVLETPGLARDSLMMLIDSDVGAALMAHMASNPEDIERIAKLSPARQTAEIGKLEDKLKAGPKTTKAPPPLSGSVKGAGSGTPSLDSADFATYKKLRAEQGARWAR